jgi:hypothetical protein
MRSTFGPRANDARYREVLGEEEAADGWFGLRCAIAGRCAVDRASEPGMTANVPAAAATAPTTTRDR